MGPGQLGLLIQEELGKPSQLDLNILEKKSKQTVFSRVYRQ